MAFQLMRVGIVVFGLGIMAVPGWARVRITYDPARTDEVAIKQAVANPVFEPENNYVRNSPFQIEGYDPLSLDF